MICLSTMIALTAITSAEFHVMSDVAFAWDAAGRADPAVAAWAWAGAPPCECNATRPECPCATQKAQYDRLRDQAIAEGRPLVVFVGCESRRVDGCLSCRWDQFPNVKGPAIVVGTPAGHDLARAAVLSADSTDAAIRQRLTPRPQCPDGECPLR